MSDNMKTITFKMEKEMAQKLKRVPWNNRRFNNQSEVMRTLVTLYLTDEDFRKYTHLVMSQRWSNLIEEDL